MTGLLAALAAACLFTVFGLFQRGRDARHRCATCPSRSGDGPCPLTECPDRATPEPPHDHRTGPRVHRSAP